MKRKLSLNNFEEVICSVAFLITIFSVVFNIVSGAITGKRFSQLEELAITSFVWITFMGVSVVYKHKSHICIDFLVQLLPDKIKKHIETLAYIIMILINICLILIAVNLSLGAIEKTTPSLGLSYFFVDLSVVLGFFCMTIRAIIDFIKHISTLVKGEV